MDTTTEIERILTHSVLDPFGILQVSRSCTPEEVKAAYRTKSRFIHPDKTKHEQARAAFEKLKKAESELMDTEKRESIRKMMAEAQRELLAEWKTQVAKGERQAEDCNESSSKFLDAAFARYKKIMVDIEWRHRQRLKEKMAAEGAAAKKEEEARNEKRRKREAEKAWEDSRDDRVSSWRQFQAKKSKSKRTKKS
ncbi:DnaJ domain-containing protein [Coemansia brasiliensis]|uniref:DnaJ domain-containing protein n=1 Tax=Coemansia brasiliensis TaxID=2650707 RepID=A0A9W8LZD3_9FUNG|nr:DnaJ domain-containing protein [Coemansia brasiliensis]